jgi:hypothetical protein
MEKIELQATVHNGLQRLRRRRRRRRRSHLYYVFMAPRVEIEIAFRTGAVVPVYFILLSVFTSSARTNTQNKNGNNTVCEVFSALFCGFSFVICAGNYMQIVLTL